MHDAYTQADYLAKKLARLVGPELASTFKEAAHDLIKSRLNKPKLRGPKRKRAA